MNNNNNDNNDNSSIVRGVPACDSDSLNKLAKIVSVIAITEKIIIGVALWPIVTLCTWCIDCREIQLLNPIKRKWLVYSKKETNLYYKGWQYSPWGFCWESILFTLVANFLSLVVFSMGYFLGIWLFNNYMTYTNIIIPAVGYVLLFFIVLVVILLPIIMDNKLRKIKEK